MDLIESHDLFMFDLDGLLVNTEELHYLSYKRMLERHGFHLLWDFETYFSIAQKDSEAVKHQILQLFPDVLKFASDWKDLYNQKKALLVEILKENPVSLLPGAELFLHLLKEKQKKMCVVTHSTKEVVEVLRHKNPELETIPFWFCREDYQDPKPSPDGYLKAIEVLANESDAVIGFEDSFRGMQALIQTRAKPVLINGFDHKMREQFHKDGLLTFSSFNEILHR